MGPGLGTSALMRVMGPLKLEASAHWTPFPFTAIYLSDQGRVEAGRINRELFAGPYAGVALHL